MHGDHFYPLKQTNNSPKLIFFHANQADSAGFMSILDCLESFVF